MVDDIKVVITPASESGVTSLGSVRTVYRTALLDGRS
jgi:hypothetical protein